MANRRSVHMPPIIAPTAHVLEYQRQDAIASVEKMHGIVLPQSHCVFVEGAGDREYLLEAAQRVKSELGEDLLDVGVGGRMSILSPRAPGISTERGGASRVGAVGEMLQEAIFRFSCLGPVCFVLDHDQAGRKVVDQLRGMGYEADRPSPAFSLDPRVFIGAVEDKGETEIEDLVAIRVHEQYFSKGKASCRVRYCEGVARRYEWLGESKAGFREYVKHSASLNDLLEVVRVLAKVREAWGELIPDCVADLLEIATDEEEL